MKGYEWSLFTGHDDKLKEVYRVLQRLASKVDVNSAPSIAPGPGCQDCQTQLRVRKLQKPFRANV